MNKQLSLYETKIPYTINDIKSKLLGIYFIKITNTQLIATKTTKNAKSTHSEIYTFKEIEGSLTVNKTLYKLIKHCCINTMFIV